MNPAGKFIEVTDTVETPGLPSVPKGSKEYIAWFMKAFHVTRDQAKREYRRKLRTKIYESPKYIVHVTLPEKKDEATHVSIRRRDRRSVTSWRDFQDIKNQLCGPEREAVEMYPAESRLVDGANQYHLWVAPEGNRFPFGFDEGRQVDYQPTHVNGSQCGEDGIDRHNHPEHGVIEIDGGDE